MSTSFKFIVAGDSKTGKTSFLITYASNTFPSDYVPTVFDNYNASVKVDDKDYQIGLWDTAGQEDYDRLRPLSYPDTNFFMLCYDTTNEETFKNIESKWIPEIKQYCPDTPFAIIGLKSDEKAKVKKAKVKKLAKKHKAAFTAEVSAKSQKMVSEVFNHAIRVLVKGAKKAGKLKITKEKKEKKKKEKLVYLEKNSFSKLYESQLDNKDFSDFTIKVEATGKSFSVHKIVLASQSEVFEGLVKSANEYTFEKQYPEELVKVLLRFYYSGVLDVSDKALTFQFVLLANKLKSKNVKGIKIPAKLYFNGLLEYVEKDLENRAQEFESLIEGCNFKALDKEFVFKLYKKKPFLQKSLAFMNLAFQNDFSDEEEAEEEEGSDEEKSGSESDESKSGSDSDESKSGSESDESKSGSDSESGSESESESESDEEEDGELPKFQPKLGSTTISYEKKNSIAKYNSSSWQGTALGTACSKYSIKILAECASLMMGFAPKTINKSGDNYTKVGWYFYLYNGTLYSQDGMSGTSFSNDYGNQANTIYGAVFDKKKGTIKFYKNGKCLGTGYSTLKKLKPKIFPAFDFYECNSKIQFVKGKYKNK